jgi:hypothetical protein
MSKYIPKVGEVFQVYNDTLDGWHSRSEAVLITDKQVVYLDDYGMAAAICLTRGFRQIQTKADVEREQLNALVQYAQICGGEIVEGIQQAGFTIPKKIKRSDVRSIVRINSSMTGYRDEVLIEEIFNLLGDLVEQDGIGGVE